MLTNKLTGAGAADKTYIEDVFSTYLYTGNGSTQTINNGIDLAGKGGLVWIKCRNSSQSNAVFDTSRGGSSLLRSNLTNAAVTDTNGISSFNSNGYSLGSGDYGITNDANMAYASWTFREAPKFFDIQLVTANSNGSVTFNHSLGQVPGMIIFKATNVADGWFVWHRSLGNSTMIQFNGTGAAFTVSNWCAPTSTSVVVTGALAASYQAVAYLFAHDTTTDGLIQCGSCSSVEGTQVNLGWEPQFVLLKSVGAGSSWRICDSMRGMSQTSTAVLFPNISNSESTVAYPSYVLPTSTGFTVTNPFTSDDVIYMAIRRGPMRTPTDGTKVFESTAYTIDSTYPRTIGSLSAPDTAFNQGREANGWGSFSDRLRGRAVLYTPVTDIEYTGTSGFYGFDKQSGAYLINNRNGNGTYIQHLFKRAPGFFDVVCYTGTGVARTVNHNLGVAPELYILKCRSSGSSNWVVSGTILQTPASDYLYLNSTSAKMSFANILAAPTATTIGFGSGDPGWTSTNSSGATYVAYLFASCPGVSKIGSYTGNGSSQTINCGFSAGARFVLIKRTNSSGNWYIWDTARGIVGGSDPSLMLNDTSPEEIGSDTIDPDSTGFIVNQLAGNNVNVSGGSYIYLAIA